MRNVGWIIILGELHPAAQGQIQHSVFLTPHTHTDNSPPHQTKIRRKCMTHFSNACLSCSHSHGRYIFSLLHTFNGINSLHHTRPFVNRSMHAFARTERSEVKSIHQLPHPVERTRARTQSKYLATRAEPSCPSTLLARRSLRRASRLQGVRVCGGRTDARPKLGMRPRTGVSRDGHVTLSVYESARCGGRPKTRGRGRVR